MRCLFASDLHGHVDRYRKLFGRVGADPPDAVLLGGDLLPNAMDRTRAAEAGGHDFIGGYIARELATLATLLGDAYPQVLVILGNDDPRYQEQSVLDVASDGLWTYVHARHVVLRDVTFFGYAFVPPTPFQLKDWERYDVSRHVDPGAVSPEDGKLSAPVSAYERRYSTIQKDLDQLTEGHDLSHAVMLFHAPPYRTNLDRAALDGRSIDHVPLDVNVGSIAIRRFIESQQPLITLHGHIHESARLTGSWSDRIGSTYLFGAAHDGPELALVEFDTAEPGAATRELV